jgi:hypothetical protein
VREIYYKMGIGVNKKEYEQRIRVERLELTSSEGMERF